MWKRLSRLWKKAESFDGSERDIRLSRAAEVEPSEPIEPVVKTDPMQLALARFDEELAACGVEAVVERVRELLHAAPTDARVLRRAAALSRQLGDDQLAAEFEHAATSSSGEPLADLGHAFLGMDDPELALAFGDGAIARARRRRVRSDDGDDGLGAGRLVGALALSRMGEHAQVVERLKDSVGAGDDSDEGIGARVRLALAALALGDGASLERVLGRLGPAETWVDQVRARVEQFPSASEGYSSDPQRLLFTLYGSLLLDDATDGERLEPRRLVRWMEALATIVRELLPDGTRPAWVSPRGEVLARWLASYLPDEAAIPLSARLPKQPVLVVLADDGDLAALVESRAWQDGGLPVFQALKDPGEIGSPMVDVIGVFRGDIALPFEGLEAERAADRLPPRLVLGRLVDEAQASQIEPTELDGFLAWVRARAPLLSVTAPPPADERIPLDVARDF